MTMDYDLFLCLLEAAWKVPFIPAVDNERSVGEIQTEIKDPSVAELTRGTFFRYTAQARRLSFPSSSFFSGTLTKDFKSSQLSYLFVIRGVPPGGLLMAGKVLASSLF